MRTFAIVLLISGVMSNANAGTLDKGVMPNGPARNSRPVFMSRGAGEQTGPATGLTSKAPPGPPAPCSQPWFRNIPMREGIWPLHKTQRHVRALIRCAVRRWPVEGGLDQALYISRRESGQQPWANNGICQGIFQLHHSYFPEWIQRFLQRSWFRHWPPSPFNARANIIIAIRMAHQQGWGAWAT